MTAALFAAALTMSAAAPALAGFRYVAPEVPPEVPLEVPPEAPAEAMSETGNAASEPVARGPVPITAVPQGAEAGGAVAASTPRVSGSAVSDTGVSGTRSSSLRVSDTSVSDTSVSGTSVANTSVWHVREGEMLRTALARWGARAGVGVLFLTDRRYRLDAAASFEGGFMEAVQALFRGLSHLPHPPVATRAEGAALVVRHRLPGGTQEEGVR